MADDLKQIDLEQFKSLAGGDNQVFQSKINAITTDLFGSNIANLQRQNLVEGLQKTATQGLQIIDATPFEKGIGALLDEQDDKRSIYDYNILDYGNLLRAGIDLLTRAIVVKEDAQELTLRAINDLLERRRVKRENDAFRRELDKATGHHYLSLDDMKKTEISLAQALSDISLAGADASGLLQAKKLEIEKDRIGRQIKIKENQIKALETKLNASIEWNQDLLARFMTAGSASNMIERIATLKVIFQQNLTEGYWRLKAANEGLQVIFPDHKPSGAKPDFLKLKKFNSPSGDGTADIGYCDELLNWARETSFVVDRIRKNYTQKTVIISLRAFFKNADWAGKMKSLHDNASLTLDLSNSFTGMKNAKLLGVRVSFLPAMYGRANWDQYRHQTAAYSGELTPPEQKDTSDRQITVSKFKFADAMIFDLNQRRDVMTPPSTRNISPAGKWSLSLTSKGHVHYGVGNPFNVDDIWIEFFVEDNE